jgi:NADPH2:quinone reductase
VPLPDDVSFDVGASPGIPALTAYRTLTLSDLGPSNLRPGALAATTVLVQGGAGAVGHAAIQLAVWARATVIATISSPYKAELARRAGAHHVFNYRTGDVAARVKEIAPSGMERIVEVDLATDLEVVAAGGSIATYTATADQVIAVPTLVPILKSVQMSFVFTYTTSATRKADAAAGGAAAVADHAMKVSEEHGLFAAHGASCRTSCACLWCAGHRQPSSSGAASPSGHRDTHRVPGTEVLRHPRLEVRGPRGRRPRGPRRRPELADFDGRTRLRVTSSRWPAHLK